VLSGKGDVDDMVSGLAAGVRAYFTKPFNPREFGAKVDELLAER
jgi:DNA-binding response OmpR family regulator